MALRTPEDLRSGEGPRSSPPGAGSGGPRPRAPLPPVASAASRRRGDDDRYINRELSWLDFDHRVLAMAGDVDLPILERVKFVAIAASNLDEFFQVRVAGLKDQLAAGLPVTTPDGRTVAEQLGLVAERAAQLTAEVHRTFLEDLCPELARAGLVLTDWDDLDTDDRKFLHGEFQQRIFPVLTPLAVDPGHPFPYISDLSLNLAAVVSDPTQGERRFARVKVPNLLPRFVVLPDGGRFVPLEQVIAAHLADLFPGMEVAAHATFRVTRNADLTLEEEEADDLLAAVEVEVRRRRFGRAVRLEVAADMPTEVRELLVRELDLGDEDVYPVEGPLDLSGLWHVVGLDRPDLKHPSWVPVTQVRLTGEDDKPVSFFRAVRRGDVLVHHPYESFGTSVEEFVRQASADPKVLAIKITLYRTSGDSSIIHSLIRAAERGKQVVALVELKARFDEEANIEWARALEQAGVHVVYGLVGLKTHTKTTLVVREEPEGLRRYCHIGTGNYNPRTARTYEDLGLFTADPAVGADLTLLFNFLTGYARDVDYEKLVVAPVHMRPALVAMIRDEARHGSAGRIVLKMNSLVDDELIDELYAASRAGTRIDVVVRGICCLRPGVPGLSETIRVHSILGRFLEHSRIYWFAHGEDDRPRYLIGSADLMPRNLDRRVEALVPVGDPELRDRLWDHLMLCLDEDVMAWELDGEGVWHFRPGSVDSQEHLQRLALRRRRGGS